MLVLENDSVPLGIDEDYSVRVDDTRVTLDTVVQTFEVGASAEEIVSKYPSLRLADVYSVIGCYLRHIDDIRAYLQKRQAEADQIRQEIEVRWPSNGLREHLQARLVERSRTSQEQ